MDSQSTTFGSHSLKYGVDYRQQIGTNGADQLITDLLYGSSSAVLANSATSATVETFGNPINSGRYINFSAFFEDEWKMSERLHLSLGLRWDLNPAPRAASGTQPYTLNEITNLSTAVLAPAGTPVYHNDYSGFAPRLGAAYQLRRDAGHETVLRAGFGTFYDVGNFLALYGLFGGVGIGQTVRYPGAAFPFTAAQLTLPPPSITPPLNGSLTAPDPNLRLPYSLQWNVAVEQALGSNQTLTISYVGSTGGRLLFSKTIVPKSYLNPLFGPNLYLSVLTNESSSNYHSLQMQFQRQLRHGLQAVASYTWSHSIDDVSSNQAYATALARGNSDFDVRHNFSAALTYMLPSSYANRTEGAILGGWALDLRQTAHSGYPVDIFSGSRSTALVRANSA